jgi:hypothetical protein
LHANALIGSGLLVFWIFSGFQRRRPYNGHLGVWNWIAEFMRRSRTSRIQRFGDAQVAMMRRGSQAVPTVGSSADRIGTTKEVIGSAEVPIEGLTTIGLQ